MITIPWEWVAYLVAGVVVYSPVLWGRVGEELRAVRGMKAHLAGTFDDYITVVEPGKSAWTWEYWKAQYRPLTLLSFAVQMQCPVWFRELHAGNVVLHVGNAVVVAGIARALGMGEVAAVVAGLMMVVHPFAVNTVGYVTGRGSVLAGLIGGLGALGIVMGWGWVAAPCLVLAFWAKEDSLGFGVMYAGLLAVTGQWWGLGAFGAAAALVFWWKWRVIEDVRAGNGDEMMRKIGLPVAWKQPWQGITVAVETVVRLPFWAVGLRQSPYHGSGIPVPGWTTGLLALMWIWLAVGAFVEVPALRIPIVLLAGPWMVYLVCPVPDQLMEYRNYSQTYGFVLLLMILVSEPWVWMLMVWFAVRTAVLAWNWADSVRMWEYARKHTSGDPSRACQEIGALSKVRGETWTAEVALREAVELNPKLAPAMNNLGTLMLEKASRETPRREEWWQEGRYWLERCVERCPEFAVGWQDIGRLNESEGRIDDAFRCYAKAAELEPGAYYPANRAGLMRFVEKKYDEAFEWFRQALGLRPDHLDYAYNCGMAAKWAGDEEKAGLYFNQLQGKPVQVTSEMIRPDYKG